MLFSFLETWVGEGDRYNYGAMCVPTMPCKKVEDKPKINFYARDEPIPIFLALIMGLQVCVLLGSEVFTYDFSAFLLTHLDRLHMCLRFLGSSMTTTARFRHGRRSHHSSSRRFSLQCLWIWSGCMVRARNLISFSYYITTYGDPLEVWCTGWFESSR